MTAVANHDETLAAASRAVDALAARGIEGPFEAAIVLGTGLGSLTDQVDDPVSIAYVDIPGFPQGGVSGHASELIAGRLEGRKVILFNGRAHYYETGDPRVMRVPIAMVAALDCPIMLMTNAAGSLHQEWAPGRIAIIRDHINWSGTNPLIGDTADGRFVSLTDAYDRRLRLKLKLAAQAGGVNVHEGVYMWFSGPSFETPAEIRMARTLGADLVGMSTVPEVILARRHGLKVAALSMITNYGAGIEGASPSHAETKTMAHAGGMAMRRLVRAFLKGLYDA